MFFFRKCLSLLNGVVSLLLPLLPYAYVLDFIFALFKKGGVQKNYSLEGKPKSGVVCVRRSI